MQIPLFDVQSGFGGAEPGVPDIVTADRLVDEMRRLFIRRALVRISPDTLDGDAVLSNRKLFKATGAHRELAPCPIVIPNTGYDLPCEEDQVKAAIGHGAGAVCVRPVRDSWCLEPWCCDRLFHVLQAHAMPVFCLERMVGPQDVARLAGRYPDLPILFAELNYRAHRMYLPLLEAHPNVYLSTGNNHTSFGGIEHIVKTVGANRLLFGTGFPGSDAMPAITQLMYAAVPTQAKTRIGSGNFEELMERIVS